MRLSPLRAWLPPNSQALSLGAMCALALVVSLGFFAYVSPGRLDHWGDQKTYESLGEVLASTGTFGQRLPDAPDALVAETYRTIGYPLFLAIIIKVVGAVYPAAAFIQALLVASLPALTFLFARDLMSRRLALAVSATTALYVPFAFWAAYTMSEILATFMVTIGAVSLYYALRQASLSRSLFAGACLGYAGLVRPTLAFTVVALVVAVMLAARVLRVSTGPRRILAAALVTGLAVGVVPSLFYTAVNSGRIGLVPAKPGVQVLVGYWQGIFPGRDGNEINNLIEAHATEGEIEAFILQRGMNVSRASRYAADMRTFIEWPKADPIGPFVSVNDWAWDQGVQEIRADLVGFVARGFTTRLPILLIGEIPVRYEQINSLPRTALLAIWAVQAVVLVLAVIGTGILLLRRGWAGVSGAIVASLLAYISAMHFVFYTDPRYGIYIFPLLLAAAVLGGSSVIGAVRPAAGALARRFAH